jgi:PPK2 family polyphosphate:nucleotide phosphotransferase
VKSLRVPASGIDLSRAATDSTPGVRGGKKQAEKQQEKLALRLADLQERLYANGRTGDSRRLLLVLQGLDTSGKSGTVKHVIGQVDSQGAEITSFKAPTAEEQRHAFLWRIKRRLPGPGMIGVFDRSHYEDVVAVRVRGVVPRSIWSRRYGTINRFEQELAAGGTIVVKCFLHIAFETWRERQLERLDNPAKHWKFDPGDIEDAKLWDDYLTAYSDALSRCNSDSAPWYVIPADHKWYRNHAVTKILIEHLAALDLNWPPANFDVNAQRVAITTLRT